MLVLLGHMFFFLITIREEERGERRGRRKCQRMWHHIYQVTLTNINASEPTTCWGDTAVQLL